MTARAVRAGLLYFLLVFAAGFVIGALRVAVVAPRTGALAAVALELPLMLAIAWFAAGRLMSAAMPGARAGERLCMGLLAFALLIAAEAALAIFAFGQTLREFATALAAPPGLLGLAGQIAFALIPAMRRA